MRTTTWAGCAAAVARVVACLVSWTGAAVCLAQPPATVDTASIKRFVPTASRAAGVGGVDPCAATAGVVWETLPVLGPGGQAAGSRPVSLWHNADPARFTSACWEGMRTTAWQVQFGLIHGGGASAALAEFPRGYRGNISLLTAAVPGTYYPASPELGGSTESLLPPGKGRAPTGWQGQTRPTIDQTVDLVTGLPLISVTDLELPVGDATFRLKRTRSALHGHMFPNISAELAKWPADASDRLWDWTGAGWMISENPLLLIDDTRSDVVGDAPPTCWLVLDAHRSIPFQWVPGINRYEAPPRFRATMTYTRTAAGGGRDATGVRGIDGFQIEGWQSRPLEYTVTLYDGALTYTFAAVYEDVPTKTWYRSYDTEGAGEAPASYHDRPTLPDAYRSSGSTLYANSEQAAAAGVPEHLLSHHPFNPLGNRGLGMPYMGLCTRVEDRHGHVVEINYCGVEQRSMDSGRGAECVECWQSCLRKGQISHVLLRDATGVKWTLVYSHRLFPGVRWGNESDARRPTVAETQQLIDDYFSDSRSVTELPANWGYPLDLPYGTNPERYETHGHVAIDRVYVYEGDLLHTANGYPGPLCLTTPSSAPALPGGVGENALASEPIELHVAAHDVPPAQAAALRSWKYRVRHDYNVARSVVEDHREDWVRNGQEADPVQPWGPRASVPVSPPLLVLTTVERREPGGEVRQQDRRAYVYDSPDHTLSSDGASHWTKAYDHPLNQRGGVYLVQYQRHAAHLVGLPWLAAVLDQQDLAALLAPVAPGSAEPTLKLSEVALQRVAGSDAFLSDQQRERVLKSAKVRYGFAATSLGVSTASGPHAPSWQSPTVADLFAVSAQYGAYLTVAEAEKCKYDGHPATVGDYTRREGDRERAYRIHRLIRYPNTPGASSGDEFYSIRENHSPTSGSPPKQSVFLSPFYWHACQGAAENNYTMARQAVAPPDLSQPRFMVVVDEFASRAAMMSTEHAYSQSDQGARKEGMTARTVYEINAAGYVLKTRRWDYSATGASVASQGIGEEYRYSQAGSLVCTNPDWQATGCNVTLPSELSNEPAVAPRAFLKELVLTEKRSLGSSVAHNLGQGETKGLIEFFEYRFNGTAQVTVEQFPWSTRLEQIAAGFQSGTAGTRYYTGQNFFAADQPGVLKASVRFNTAQTELLPGVPALEIGVEPDPAMSVTHYLQQRRQTDPSVPDYQRPVLWTQVVEPPHRQRPGGPLYYPIQRTVYSQESLPEWQVTGLVRNPLSPNSVGGDPLQRLVMSYTSFGPYGRVSYNVVDVEPGTSVPDPSAPGAYTLSIPSWPAEVGDVWQRIGGGVFNTPLNSATLNWYDHKGELTDSFRPSGRWSRRSVIHDPDLEQADDEWFEEFTFDGLTATGAMINGQPSYNVDRAGRRRSFHGKSAEGKPLTDEVVEYTAAVVLSIAGQNGSTPASTPSYQVVKKRAFKHDAFGRVRGVEELEPTAMPGGQVLMLPSGGREINDLGEVYRQWDYGGNVNRWTRNHLGHKLRRYEGSVDAHWGVGGFDPTAQGEANERGSFYDMVLKERTQFGSGINDVWQPVVERRYVRNPAWAHTLDQSGGGGYYGQPPVHDADGIVTRHAYDWRGRAVRTDRFELGDDQPASGPAAARIGTTLRYMDHVGREVLTAEFGPLMGSLPASLDPTLYGPGAEPPAAAAFYGLAVRPVSLTERVFDSGDRPVEERAYDTSAPLAGGVAPFTARRQMVGPGGLEVFTQSANGRCEVVSTDGLGRPTQRAVVLYQSSTNPLGYQLQRTDLTLDAQGRTIAERVWERVRPTGESLDPTNAVSTTRWMWYNGAGQRTAEADLGTGVQGQDGWTVFRAASGVAPMRPDDGPRLDPQTLAFVRGDVPASAKVIATAYDRAGRAAATIDAQGVITAFVYQGEKVVSVREHVTGPQSHARTRLSSFGHGRLKQVAMLGELGERPSGQNDKASAVCVYGAPVVDDAFVERSWDRTAVGAMGRLSETASAHTGIYEFTYAYNFLGQLAERTAADGVVTRYRYDALGRLTSIEVGHRGSGGAFVPGYPAQAGEVAGDRIGYVEFKSTWTATGGVPIETRDVTARVARQDPQNPATPGRVISHVRQRFDGLGRLVREWQSHGGEVDAATPSVQYTWAQGHATVDSAGWSRLAGMTYPELAGETARTVAIGYGAAGSVDDALCRIVSLTSVLPGQPGVALAAYAYSGDGRRVSATLGASGVVQTLDGDQSAVGLSGLDGFGRIVDLSFRAGGGTGATMYAARYDYDRADRLVASRTTHAPIAGQAQDNNRSSLYQYDPLGRLAAHLLGSAAGTWSTSAGAGEWSIAPGTLLRRDSWHLDAVENQSLSAPMHAGWTLADAGGRISSGNLDWHGTPLAYPGATAAADALVARASTTDRSDLAEVRRAVAGTGGTVSSSSVVMRDACGRVVSDGSFYYHYDAWGRLVQVNVAKYSPDGGPDGTPEWSSGSLIRHMVYDGLGRLIRLQSPVVAPSIDPAVGQVELLGQVRSELLYYDGVRRISSVLVDPVDPKAAALLSEELAEQQAAQSTGSESGGQGGGGSVGSSTAGGESANSSFEKVLAPASRLSREYVWGPGDSFAGVDELVCQFGGSMDGDGQPSDRSKPWWVIQDLTGDAVAVVEKPSSSQAAAVAWQCTYEPYGGVLASRTLRAHPPLWVGHKGLFADNLDAQVYTALSPQERPVLSARLPLHYHVRNRSLLSGEPVYPSDHPEAGAPRAWAGGMGRFLQPDPNATGVGVMEPPAWHGEALAAPTPHADLAAWSGDGVGAVSYCGGEPVNGADAMGLFIGPTTTMDLWSDHAQSTLEAGNDVRGHVMDMFGEYSLNSIMDFGWATDWSLPDDLYAGSANERMGSGSWGGGSSGLHHGADSTGYARAASWVDPSKSSRLRQTMRGDATGLGVYIVLDSDNNIIYAGRSKDLATRMHKQQRVFAKATGQTVRVIGREIRGRNAKATVRALEQMLIATHGLIENGHNKINGVGRNNRNIQEYLRALAKFR